VQVFLVEIPSVLQEILRSQDFYGYRWLWPTLTFDQCSSQCHQRYMDQ